MAAARIFVWEWISRKESKLLCSGEIDRKLHLRTVRDTGDARVLAMVTTISVKSTTSLRLILSNS